MERTNGWPGSAGEHVLQQERGTTDRAHRFYSQQVLDRLNDRMREFLAEQEMMFVATADGKGECDNTFRAGPPGFVRVLGEDRLAWPEYRGNGVMASLGNITENPQVGLLFIDFFRQVIGLHVNGHAKIVEDRAMRAAHPDLPVESMPGRRPERWVVVQVEEAYIHCAKHIPRLAKISRERDWGTDDVRRKGGDFFGAAAESRPWRPEETPAGAIPPPRPDRPAPRVEKPAPRLEKPAPRLEKPAPRVGEPAVPPQRPGDAPEPVAPLAMAGYVGRASVRSATRSVEPLRDQAAVECAAPRHRTPRGHRVLRRLIRRFSDPIED